MKDSLRCLTPLETDLVWMVSPEAVLRRGCHHFLTVCNIHSMKKLLSFMGIEVYDTKQPVTKFDNVNISSANTPEFIKWCEEFNVGILSNKNSEVVVKVGNHEKVVKLERL